MTEPENSLQGNAHAEAAPTERWKVAAARSGGDALAERTAAPRRKLYSDEDKGSVASTLFGGSGTFDRPAWSDTASGRALIRVVSRGIFGAAAFTLGGHIAKQQLHGYDTHTPMKLGDLRPSNALQYVARGIDRGIGRPLEFMAHTLTIGDARKKADAAWNITNFRSKMFNEWGKDSPLTHPDKYGVVRPLNGRGLGAEIVTVTFDFFLASIGDATVRNIIQAFDPNVKQPWIIDADGKATVRGKGHFDVAKWGQSLLRSSWRIVTKNAGEDWAAALPYVYQMKWQRQALSKIWPGFKISSDNNVNGAVCQINEHGMITGGYQAAGALDLHCRFVGYNWYTLMYREGYAAVAHAFNQWKDDGFKLSMPKISNPVTALVDGAGFTVRYAAKSFLKSNLYMQPAVLAFWPIRTPQTKWRGFYVNEDAVKAVEGDALSQVNAIVQDRKGIFGHPHTENGHTDFIGDPKKHAFSRSILKWDQENWNLFNKGERAAWWNNQKIPGGALPGDKNHIYNITSPYDLGTKRNAFDSVLNVFGAASFALGSGLTNMVDRASNNRVDPVTRWMHKGKGLSDMQLLHEREKTLHLFGDTAASYTPYMWAKAETALHVDDRRSITELGEMDKALYSDIDALMAGDFKGLGQNLKKTWKLATHIEKEVKSREGSATPPGDGSSIPRAEKADVPATTVAASSIERAAHDPASLSRDDSGDRGWAEAVAGRKLGAEYVQGSRSTH